MADLVDWYNEAETKGKLSPGGLFRKKSLSPHKIWGQQGDKREKVK